MATLTSTITEAVTLNGVERGSTNVLSVGSVTQVLHRIVTLPANGGSGTSYTTICNFRTAVTTADSALADETVKYIRITNLASTDVMLSLQLAANGGAAASTTATVDVEPGHTFLLSKAVAVAVVDDDGATELVSGLQDLESIVAINDQNAVAQVEIFIAS